MSKAALGGCLSWVGIKRTELCCVDAIWNVNDFPLRDLASFSQPLAEEVTDHDIAVHHHADDFANLISLPIDTLRIVPLSTMLAVNQCPYPSEARGKNRI